MASSAAQVHQRWMAYERFAKLHATAIDPGFAGGVGAAVAYRQRVMVTAAEVLFSTASRTVVCPVSHTGVHLPPRLLRRCSTARRSWRAAATAAQTRAGCPTRGVASSPTFGSSRRGSSSSALAAPARTPARRCALSWLHPVASHASRLLLPSPRVCVCAVPCHPSLATRRYMLLRDRFVRIPLNGADPDSVPGDEFELHAYLLRTCCEQARLHARTRRTRGLTRAHARTHACSCAHSQCTHAPRSQHTPRPTRQHANTQTHKHTNASNNEHFRCATRSSCRSRAGWR